MPSNKKLIWLKWILAVKVTLTFLFWGLPLLLFPMSLLQRLGVPPDDTMFRQKDEQRNLTAQKELTYQREIYLALQERYQITLVSNHGDKDETIDLVVLKTLQTYFKDYSTWINGLLLANPNQMKPKGEGG